MHVRRNLSNDSGDSGSSLSRFCIRFVVSAMSAVAVEVASAVLAQDFAVAMPQEQVFEFLSRLLPLTCDGLVLFPPSPRFLAPYVKEDSLSDVPFWHASATLAVAKGWGDGWRSQFSKHGWVLELTLACRHDDHRMWHFEYNTWKANEDQIDMNRVERLPDLRQLGMHPCHREWSHHMN